MKVVYYNKSQRGGFYTGGIELCYSYTYIDSIWVSVNIICSLTSIEVEGEPQKAWLL